MQEYKILAADTIERNARDLLAREVTTHLNDGWSCVGGISMSDNGHNTIYCQAIVKQLEPPGDEK